MSLAAHDGPPLDAGSALRASAALEAEGRALEALELLREVNRSARDPEVECRLDALRHRAFDEVAPASRFETWPVDVDGIAQGEPARIPDLAPAELTGDAVRRAMATHGSVRIPGLLDAGQVQGFTDGIDHVLGLRASNKDTPYKTHSSWWNGLPLPREQAQSLGRPWVAGAGGFLACDSPRLLELLFVTYEQIGLRRLLADYLGERPILSANKCTLRRVPTTAKADWHQDGAFLGRGIRALNVWIALSDCGRDAPGMDLVPRRFERVQETGTGGALFDWAVGPQVVAALTEDAPVVRPHFAAGDALLFDDLFLHRTAVEPTMTRPRYAIESWFFAKTSYPEGQVPLVW